MKSVDGSQALAAKAVVGHVPSARTAMLVVPKAPPRPVYDAIVSRSFSTLTPQTMERLARQGRGGWIPGGQLVLAHHRITFYDFAQRAEGIYGRVFARL